MGLSESSAEIAFLGGAIWIKILRAVFKENHRGNCGRYACAINK